MKFIPLLPFEVFAESLGVHISARRDSAFLSSVGGACATAKLRKQLQDRRTVESGLAFAESRHLAELGERCGAHAAECLEGGVVQDDKCRNALLLRSRAPPLPKTFEQLGCDVGCDARRDVR